MHLAKFCLIAGVIATAGGEEYEVYDPEDADADHMEYAIMMDQDGEPAEALKAFRASVKFSPTSEGAWNNLGVALCETDDLVAAEDALKKAVDMGSEDAQETLDSLTNKEVSPPQGIVKKSAVGGDIYVSRNNEDFHGIIDYHKEHTGLPVVIDFFSESCGPCHMIYPYVKEVAKDFKGRAVFVKVDIDRDEETSYESQIRVMPTFHFYLNGVKQSFQLDGADPNMLERMTLKAVMAAEKVGTYHKKPALTEQDLRSFYEKHDQGKVGEAARVAHMFQHRTALLARHMTAAYGAVPECLAPATEADPEAAAAPAEEAEEEPAAAPAEEEEGEEEPEFLKESREGALATSSLQQLEEEVAKRHLQDSAKWLSETSAYTKKAAKAAPADNHRKMVVIGGGPAGLSAAIYAARAGLQPLVLAPLIGGQLLGKGVDVENYPGVTGVAATGRGIVSLMRLQARGFQCAFQSSAVASIEQRAGGGFTIALNGTESVPNPTPVTADTVVLATGSDSRWLNVPGEEKLQGNGVSSCATCDGFIYRNKAVMVIGGGDTAMEDALVLARTSSSVTLIHRSGKFRASHILAERVKANKGIKILWHTKVLEFKGGAGGELTSAVLETTAPGGGSKVSELMVAAAFVAIGHEPNAGFVTGLLETDDHGYVKVLGDGSTFTSVPGIFAAGDVADKVYRQAVTSAGTGAMAALDAERWLSTQ
jgi:thioredoxin-disulfide reductase